ncbi:MAG: hypothetical protein HW416_3575 [Chloroflexi bacterium]|nr:hypothetical protein [Chloroflexota bacterium]
MSTYERWIRDEGVPVIRGHGIQDLRDVELGEWKRLGGKGAYIQLQGQEGFSGLYTVEIPPGGSLNVEKHMYDELIYVLRGTGTTEIWSDKDGPRKTFEWQTGTLFAPPMNTYHKLYNASGTETARLLGATSAPLIMDVFHNTDFIFNSDFVFTDRYNGRDDYFNVGPRHQHTSSWGEITTWETNYIPDVRGTSLNSSEHFGEGNTAVNYDMSGNVYVGHMAEWPVGKYRKAHHHGGGAILIIVRSEGYTLLWPPSCGLHPFQGGHEDEVVRVDWREGGVRRGVGFTSTSTPDQSQRDSSPSATEVTSLVLHSTTYRQPRAPASA